MNRRYLLVLGALVASAPIAACGDDEDNGDGSEEMDGSAGSGGTSGGAGSGGTAGGGGGNTAGAGGSGGDMGDAGGSGGTDGGDGAPPDASPCAVTPPAEWSAPDFDANAAEALALRTQLITLMGTDTAGMRGMERGAVAVDGAANTAAFEDGSPSLSDITTSGFMPIATDAFAEFVTAAGAGDQDLVDAGGNWTPGAAGGIWSTNDRAINEGGLELRQILDKALFAGGAFYAYALGLTEGTIDAATIDALAAIWGANPTLSPGASTDPDPARRNVHTANYAYQMGFFGDARRALIDAKAYAADAECTAERDAALVTFFRSWERSMYARFFFYANGAAADVAGMTTVDDEVLAAALHELSEGLGLALGFYGLESPTAGPLSSAGRIITDAQIVQALGHLTVNPTESLGSAMVGDWVENSGGFTNAVIQVESVIVDVYDVTQAEIDDYRTPTAG